MAKEILIAESDKMVQEEFERILEATDHHLIFTTNDEETLLRARLFKPDIIIGRRDLCQTIRSNHELKDIRFIILLDMFEDLSEKECKQLKADGMISRPLKRDEVISTVTLFIGGTEESAGDKVNSENNKEWKSFSDIGKVEAEEREEFSLDLSGGIEEEEEIIELVDVVEEPESKMSIDDFALQQKGDLAGEIAPLESWEKPEREEEGQEKELLLPPKDKGLEIEEIPVQIEESVVEKKVSPGDEFFEKIALEDVLRKMEGLQPAIDKEWPLGKEEKIPEQIPKEKVPPSQKGEDRFADLDEFEAALKGEVKIEPKEEELQPFYFEEAKKEAPGPGIPGEEAPTELDLQELSEEEFPEIFLEELTEELEKLEEKELMPGETTVEVEEETTEEEEISELFGEEIQPPKQELTEAVRVEEPPLVEELFPMEEIAPAEKITPVDEFKEVEVAGPKMTEIPKVTFEEVSPPFMRLDQKIEEVITKGVEEMMQDFMTKVVPDMARHMITSTMERIETMVKEVIPDMAEKAIQEEIKRLQKGEKD